MTRLNSSTFNSDGANLQHLGRAIHVACWVVIGLVTIDLLINILLPYPNNPKAMNPSFLQAYFEYGRSAEGQLSRMTKADRSQTAPITLSGWYEPLEAKEFPSKSQDPIVTFYGMSHAVRLGNALHRGI